VCQTALVSYAYSKRRERNSSYCLCNSLGNLAVLAAVRRASSIVVS
jgi:hypothetical protein